MAPDSPIVIKGHEAAFALLYSAIGYHPGRVKRAMVRQTTLGEDKAQTVDVEKSKWRLLTYRGEELQSGCL